MFSYDFIWQTLGTGALVVTAMLDLLTFALCVPYCETTDGKHFDILLEMVASRGRSLFKLFQVFTLFLIYILFVSCILFLIIIDFLASFNGCD